MVLKSTLETARFACGLLAIDNCLLLQSARVSCKTSAKDRRIPHLTGAYR